MTSTAGIKQRLNIHRKMVAEYDNLQKELNIALEKYGGLQGVRYEAMPKGGSRIGNGRIENAVIRKMGIEERLKAQGADIERDWAEIEPMIAALKPMEALVIRLRYKYALEWGDICCQLYGKKSDYTDEQNGYMNRIFKIHGHALFAIAERNN